MVSPSVSNQAGGLAGTTRPGDATGSAVGSGRDGEVEPEASTGVQPRPCLQPIDQTMSDNLEAILRLEVPLIVQIACRTMPLKEVVALVPGAIIELPKNAEDDLEILVNNKPVGTGRAVKVGENFGIRVGYIGDVTHRIAALGGRTAATLME